MKRNVHEIWTDNSSVAPLGNHFSSKFISTEQKRTRSDSSFYPDDRDHSHDPEIRRKDHLSQSSARNYSEYCLSNDRNKSNNFAYYSCDLSASCGGVTSSYDDCFHNSRLSDEVEDHDFESSHVIKRPMNHDLKSTKALHPLRQVSPSPSCGSAATSRHSSRSAATVPSNEKVKEFFCRSVVSHDRYPPCPSSSSRSSERSRSPARAITARRPVPHQRPSSSAPMLTPPPDYYSDLPLEWWEREEDCKTAKMQHMERVDNVCRSREDLVLLTTLWRDDITMEPNMFPYKTPFGVEHFTLWSVQDLSHRQIQQYVDNWLWRHCREARRWQYDDNSGERSIDLFHVHVFVETAPYAFRARPELLYLPPHLQPPPSLSLQDSSSDGAAPDDGFEV